MALVLVFILTFITACTSTKSSQIQNTESGKACYKVVAHRGASGYRPEHTQAAYELALEMGADFIEPDLVITKDGVLIARHENELSLTTDVAIKFPLRKTTKTISGKVVTGWFAEDFSLAEIKTLKAKQRFPFRDQSFDGKFSVMTFSEVIELAQNYSKKLKRPVGVFPETKNPSYFQSIKKPLEEALLSDLKKASLNQNEVPVIIQSFELSSLKKLKQKTDLPLVFLIGNPKELPEDALITKDPRTYGDFLKPQELAELAKTVQGIGPWKGLIVPEVKGELQNPTRLIQDAHDAKLLVYAYTFRSDKEALPKGYAGQAQKEYEQFCQLKIDGVFSDFPDDAIRFSR